MIDLPKWEIVENKLPHSFAGLITSGMYEGTMFFISELYLISYEDFEYKVVTDVVYDGMKVGINQNYDALNEITTLLFFSHIEHLPTREICVKKD